MARQKFDAKRIVKGPFLYIVIGAIALWVGFALLNPGGFRSITTQEGLELLEGGTVEKATIIDGEQRVDLELSEADGDNGTRVQFQYVAPRGEANTYTNTFNRVRSSLRLADR